MVNLGFQKAWEIFEQYAEGDFNVVKNYSYNSIDSFFQSSIEFVPIRERKSYMKEIFEEYYSSLI